MTVGGRWFTGPDLLGYVGRTVDVDVVAEASVDVFDSDTGEHLGRLYEIGGLSEGDRAQITAGRRVLVARMVNQGQEAMRIRAERTSGDRDGG